MMSKKKLIVVGSLVLFLLICLGYYLFINSFRVVNIDPKGNIASPGAAIIFTFSQELKNNPDIELSDDTVAFTKKVDPEDQRKLIITPDGSTPIGVKFTIQIKNIVSKTGKTIGSFSHDVTTKQLTGDQLSEDQRKELTADVNSNFVDNPILSHLPYSSLNFSLTNDSIYQKDGSEKQYIIITPNVVPTNKEIDEYQQQYDDYTEQGRQYIRGLGLSTNGFEIVSNNQFNEAQFTKNAAPFGNQPTKEYASLVDQLVKKYPQLSEVPYKGVNFSITLGSLHNDDGSDEKVALYLVYYTDTALSEAEAWLNSHQLQNIPEISVAYVPKNSQQ